jgi:hypothetical protein
VGYQVSYVKAVSATSGLLVSSHSSRFSLGREITIRQIVKARSVAGPSTIYMAQAYDKRVTPWVVEVERDIQAFLSPIQQQSLRAIHETMVGLTFLSDFQLHNFSGNRSLRAGLADGWPYFERLVLPHCSIAHETNEAARATQKSRVSPLPSPAWKGSGSK